eukprot:94529-Prymnesium_polylepis.2
MRVHCSAFLIASSRAASTSAWSRCCSSKATHQPASSTSPNSSPRTSAAAMHTGSCGSAETGCEPNEKNMTIRAPMLTVRALHTMPLHRSPNEHSVKTLISAMPSTRSILPSWLGLSCAKAAQLSTVNRVTTQEKMVRAQNCSDMLWRYARSARTTAM